MTDNLWDQVHPKAAREATTVSDGFGQGCDVYGRPTTRAPW